MIMTARVKRFPRERRRAPRFRVLGEVEARLLSTDLPLLLLDISSTGFAVQSPIDFEPGFAYEFRFASRHAANFRVQAMNIHCLHVFENGKPMYVAGFAFATTMSATERMRIAAIIQGISHTQRVKTAG
jgi:hypothetical protein